MGVQAAQVSTLADAVRLVQRLFSEAGDGTPIFVGAQHLDNLGPGFAPRIVFVPDEEGELGPPLKLNAGYVASWTHSAAVTVLGVEPGDDEGRFEPAYLIASRVIEAVKALDPAHLTVGPGRPRDVSALKAGGPGAAVRFTLTYARNIPKTAAIWRAAATLTAVSPPDVDRPEGSTGLEFDVSATAAPTAARDEE